MVRRIQARTSEPAATDELFGAIRSSARPLVRPEDLDPILDRIGDAHFVLLGEASHGTSEYYRWRTALSKRLIAEKGFSFIAVEGDWPDCYRINRYVRGLPDAGDSARSVLRDFQRWPTWMWANEEVVELAQWLRRWNDRRPARSRVGFYGLDVYSLWESLDEVVTYLQKSDGEALAAARRAVRCFEPFGGDEQQYARATRWVSGPCEQEVVELLRRVRAQAAADPKDDPEDRFAAEQNALVLKNAEAYYRAMVQSGQNSWNVRDHHMSQTLDRLVRHHGPDARAIVWAHNTHIGDARYTDMAEDGMINLGQLTREGYGRADVVLVGFGSHSGSVIAGREWGEPWKRRLVPPGRPGSWEDVLHRAWADGYFFVFTGAGAEAPMLEPRGHRAVGVVYRPEYEHLGNYVPTVMPRRYDVFVYLDRTNALRPLHARGRVPAEVPETYPSGV